MHYDVKHCKIDPKEFNCLPPSFDPDNCDGWSMLCNSIFKKDETLVKAIHHLQETHDLNNGAFDPFSSASATFDLGQGFNFATARQSTKRMTIRGRAKSIEKSSKDVQALPSNRDRIIKLQNDPSKKRQSQRKNAEKQKEIISRIGFFKNDPLLLQFVPNIKQKTKIGLSWKKFLARNIKNSALKSRSKEKERTKSPAQRQVRARTTSLTKRITKNRVIIFIKV
ncbi:unnamed protein product [Moneuplotes crassus]|uniref:Uncharacterized protein n=1 Tax=Euplotes crassus TaxID=5936 RepID=A0AAD1UA12_EUPCR|nr:unnamed protein product [Moneuplotes crassus]